MIRVACILLLSPLMVNLDPAYRPPAGPDFFPRIEHYFNSLDPALMDTGRVAGLCSLKASITSGITSGRNIEVLFIDPDNSFRSQEAQIVLQSLVLAAHMDKLRVLSAGYTVGKLDPRLLRLLALIGYQVKLISGKQDKEPVYSIQFSKRSPPVIVFAKKFDDFSIPRSIYHVIKTCTADDEKCSDIPGALFTTEQPYNDPNTIRDPKALENEFNKIAAEIYFTFRDAGLQASSSGRIIKTKA